MDYNKIICADRYDELALEMEVGNNAQDLIEWVRQVNNKFGIPKSIKEFGVKKGDLPKIVEESMPSGSLIANPRETSQEDLFHFLEDQLIKIEPIY